MEKTFQILIPENWQATLPLSVTFHWTDGDLTLSPTVQHISYRQVIFKVDESVLPQNYESVTLGNYTHKFAAPAPTYHVPQSSKVTIKQSRSRL